MLNMYCNEYVLNEILYQSITDAKFNSKGGQNVLCLFDTKLSLFTSENWFLIL